MHGSSITIKPYTAVFCSNTPPTFVNENNCRLSYNENACLRRDRDWEDIVVTVPLNNRTISELFDLTGKHVYAIEGLVFDDSNTQKFGLTPLVYTPCARNSLSVYQEVDASYVDLVGSRGTIKRADTRSRWIKDDSACNGPTTGVENSTASLFARLLSVSTGANPVLRDVTIYANMEQCDLADENKFGFAVRDTEGNCWRNVHPDFLSVYDLTDFVATVDSAASSWTTDVMESGIISYPASNSSNYTMLTWELLTREANENKIRYIGRYGDEIAVIDLVDRMQFASVDDIFQSSEAEIADNAIVDIANALGELTLEGQFRKTGRDGGVVVCGHPGEIAPDPTIEDTFEIDANGRTKPYDGVVLGSQKVSDNIDERIKSPDIDAFNRSISFLIMKSIAIFPSSLFFDKCSCRKLCGL